MANKDHVTAAVPFGNVSKGMECAVLDFFVRFLGTHKFGEGFFVEITKMDALGWPEITFYQIIDDVHTGDAQDFCSALSCLNRAREW